MSNLSWKRKITVGDFINYAILLIISSVCILPFLYILSISLTDPNVYKPFTLYFIPQKFSLAVYSYMLSTSFFMNGLKNTLFITFFGTCLNLLFTFTAAYTLTSRRDYPGKKVFLAFIVFTLIFNAGIIPNYILVKSLGLINSLWALIIPGLTNAWSLIVVKSFIESLPLEMEESARIDGCNELQSFVSIIVPLSLASIAAFTLFFAVGHWNSYFNAYIYLTNSAKWTLQLIVRTLIMDSGSDNIGVGIKEDIVMPQETLKMATVILAMLPILVVYPFLQKYFVKGVMIGAIKG